MVARVFRERPDISVARMSTQEPIRLQAGARALRQSRGFAAGALGGGLQGSIGQV